MIDGDSYVKAPRFTCAPEIRMPRFTLPIFQSNVKPIASAMSNYGLNAGH